MPRNYLPIDRGVVVHSPRVCLEREGLRQRPENPPIHFVWGRGPKICTVTARCQFHMPRRCNCARPDARHKKSETDLLATWAAVKIVQAGHHVHGTRSNLAKSQDTPLWIAEVASPAVTATSWGYSLRLG